VALGTRWVAPKGSVKTDATLADWHDHRVALAIPEGGADFLFGEAFPADAAMDSLGGIAFDKGCFVGQEVVSRMKHRGTGRRRMVVLWGAGGWPDPDTDISSETQTLGRLGSSGGMLAIGLVRLDRMRAALDAGEEIMAGDKSVLVSLPAWATYDWPKTERPASSGDGGS
jgi:folate-binding protein YgfZ